MENFTKIKIVLLAVVLVFVIGGVFVYLNFFKLTPVEKWDLAKSSPREDYIVNKTEEGTFVENKKARISFKIPDGWELYEDEFLRGVLFSSPNAEIEEAYLLNRGCQIGMSSLAIRTDIETMKKTIEDDLKLYPMTTTKIEDINISKKESVKFTIKDNIYDIEYIRIYSLDLKNVYEIVLYSNTLDIKYCEDQFNQFLETVSFN